VFQQYIQGAFSFSIKRGGIMYGSVDEEGTVRCDFIYEPPQKGTADALELERWGWAGLLAAAVSWLLADSRCPWRLWGAALRVCSEARRALDGCCCCCGGAAAGALELDSLAGGRGRGESVGLEGVVGCRSRVPTWEAGTGLHSLTPARVCPRAGTARRSRSLSSWQSAWA
jgi:hypothetical protein